jgi:glutamyl/glutaminyl-tRNA synthetase
MDKLGWLNNQYLKNEDPEKLADALVPELAARNWIDKDNFDRNYLLLLVKLLQARLTVLSDFVERADFFFQDDFPVDPKAQEKFLSRDLSKEFFMFIQRLEKLEKFEVAEIEDAFRQLVSELGIEAKVLIHPLRVALTGKTVGPGLFEVVYCLGKSRTKERLAKWIKKETK